MTDDKPPPARRVEPRNLRRRCSCGCRQRATHVGMQAGRAGVFVVSVYGCQLSVLRWARTTTPRDPR